MCLVITRGSDNGDKLYPATQVFHNRKVKRNSWSILLPRPHHISRPWNQSIFRLFLIEKHVEIQTITPNKNDKVVTRQVFNRLLLLHNHLFACPEILLQEIASCILAFVSASLENRFT